MANKLKPYYVFRDELTRLNHLYWSSKYSYARIGAILKLIASTGDSNPDPRVDKVWPSLVYGESSYLTRSLSTFIQQLSNNEGSLRTISILHLCSAFEEALANYFVICALYFPQRVDTKQIADCVPTILIDSVRYEALKKWAISMAGKKLKGDYSKRIQVFVDTFGCAPISATVLSNLDGYYGQRHAIAHDQGLSVADAPELSVDEILQTQITVSEPTWKAMIMDFQTAIEELDSTLQTSVITDLGIPLGIYRVITRDGTMKIGELIHKLNLDYRLGKLQVAAVKSSVAAMGYKLTKLERKVMVSK